MSYFTHDNTEGFSSSELNIMNEALELLVGDNGADNQYVESVGDMLNNAWHDGATVETLVSTVRRQLS